MPESRFTVDVLKGVPVVALPEEVDITNAPGMRAALLEAAADGHKTLVIDMTETRFCDSAGLDVLVNAHKRAQADGGEVLLALSGTVLPRILEITGIDQMVLSFPSVDEALARAVALSLGPRLAVRGTLSDAAVEA